MLNRGTWAGIFLENKGGLKVFGKKVKKRRGGRGYKLKVKEGKIGWWFE
jgi:hypothetical protein